MSNKSDTIYEYKKVKPLDIERLNNSHKTKHERILLNKINELCVEQNHLMKDFELYKKAFKQFVTETQIKMTERGIVIEYPKYKPDQVYWENRFLKYE